ncbi:MAG: hypothetical protein KJ706_06075 [Candidatus Omnitrophica bacterium]|nr:hypothetical protein [Candidatus Omnitrophota bacterium]MBU4590524.1 hypothetical protein [Candidatus Omnitrophota bacterium]
MTEAQFWRFLEGVLWEVHGREPMMAGMIDDPDPGVQAVGHYLMSHAILPRDCNMIPVEFIALMGQLLLQKDIQRRTREAIMMILAHNGSDAALEALAMYNMRPDKGLEVFARMALEECKDWRNGTVMKVDMIKKI